MNGYEDDEEMLYEVEILYNNEKFGHTEWMNIVTYHF